jgi:RimJ/RimL family protein N-acetyltransferase
MQVRQATISDSHRIAQIHVESWRAAYRGQMPDEVLDNLDVAQRAAFWRTRLARQPRGVFVAESNQTIIGFCDWMPSRDPDANPKTISEIVAIYVDPKHWREGAGQALCRRALEAARRDNFTAVTLWCLASNARVRDFYEKMGFHLDGATKVDNSFKSHELYEVRFRISL